MKKQIAWSVTLIVGLLSFEGCGTTHVAQVAPSTATEEVSSVEIEYSLGHYQHRFTADSLTGTAQVTTYTERNVVEHASVDSAKYGSFVAKAIAFSQKPKRTPTEESECRSPFKVVVVTGKKHQRKHTLPRDAGLPTMRALLVAFYATGSSLFSLKSSPSS